MISIYFWPTSGSDLLLSLEYPSKFQPVLHLDLITAATPLTGGQPHFAPRCLAVCLAGTLYIHFGGFCSLTEFCRLQNSLCVQILCSPILAVWLHGTRAAAVNQTLWRSAGNGITELLQTAPPIFGWAAITLGIGPHCSLHFATMYHGCRPI